MVLFLATVPRSAAIWFSERSFSSSACAGAAVMCRGQADAKHGLVKFSTVHSTVHCTSTHRLRWRAFLWASFQRRDIRRPETAEAPTPQVDASQRGARIMGAAALTPTRSG